MTIESGPANVAHLLARRGMLDAGRAFELSEKVEFDIVGRPGAR